MNRVVVSACDDLWMWIAAAVIRTLRAGLPALDSEAPAVACRIARPKCLSQAAVADSLAVACADHQGAVPACVDTGIAS